MQDSDDDNTRACTWNGRDRVAMLCQYGERSVFVRASHPHETIEEPYDVSLAIRCQHSDISTDNSVIFL